MNRKTFIGDGIWVWTSVDPDTKYFFSSYVDERNIISAGYFGRDMIRKIENGHMPTFTSDGYLTYAGMLLN